MLIRRRKVPAAGEEKLRGNFLLTRKNFREDAKDEGRDFRAFLFSSWWFRGDFIASFFAHILPVMQAASRTRHLSLLQNAKTFRATVETLQSAKMKQFTTYQKISSTICNSYSFITHESFIEEAISKLAFLTVIMLLQLPFERIDGNLVPTVIFKGRPFYFQAFVVALCFAFCGGPVTVSLREDHPKVARYYRRFTFASMTCAISIVTGLGIYDLLMHCFL
ncbi:hypothetical protein Ancab_020955 [Ancistrocladus abbreviatus]